MTPATLQWLSGIADERNLRRGYSRRRDAWGRGFVSSPTLAGLVGEYAICQFLNARIKGLALEVDVSDRPCGDDGVDVCYFGTVIQVKTRLARKDALLVRRETESGKLLPLKWEVCVQATWRPDDSPLAGWLDGWVQRTTVLSGAFKPGRKGDWMNLEIPDCHLRPMSELPDYLGIIQGMKQL